MSQWDLDTIKLKRKTGDESKKKKKVLLSDNDLKATQSGFGINLVTQTKSGPEPVGISVERPDDGSL